MYFGKPVITSYNGGPSKFIDNETNGIIIKNFMRIYVVKTHMQKVWIFANLSLAEGFGITWIEDNSCGTPFVGYKIEGLNKVDDKISRITEMGNIEKLIEWILEIRDN